ncbi:MAG: hypothetical protein LAO20_00210 [Acidobacteriia bacterium]|nr:hypothetical protein [Terriglobia bacterium]
MFVRKISVHLKPNTLVQFTGIFEKEIVPVLNKQPGFKDVITFAAPGSSDVLSFSLWETQKDADTYGRVTYNDVLKMLASVIDGTPKLETTEVLNSTFHQIRAGKLVAA